MSDHDSLAAALVAALADLTVIEKGHRANAGSYSYDYADLGDLVKLTRPRLAANGLVALTPVHDHGTGLACTVTILHTSGERLDFEPLPFPHGKDAQATGSMITYHRRYALLAALGMATGDDDDGAKAVAAPAEDAALPGLRSSLLGSIQKLPQSEKDALKEWMRVQGLPAVARMNAAQCDRVVAWLMEPGEQQ